MVGNDNEWRPKFHCTTTENIIKNNNLKKRTYGSPLVAVSVVASILLLWEGALEPNEYVLELTCATKMC
jgi:hypothetical protein